MRYEKINKRVNVMFEKGEFDDDFLNINIKEDNIGKIFDYQIFHIYNLISCLKKNDVVIDGSYTGTGKTYTSICVCSELGLSPFIICPRSVLGVWKSVCELFGVTPLCIVNYESIRSGKEIADSIIIFLRTSQECIKKYIPPTITGITKKYFATKIASKSNICYNCSIIYS